MVEPLISMSTRNNIPFSRHRELFANIRSQETKSNKKKKKEEKKKRKIRYTFLRWIRLTVDSATVDHYEIKSIT